jgi:hypothetical protein
MRNFGVPVTVPIVFGNRQVYAVGDAFADSHVETSGGRRTFGVAGGLGVPHGLHPSEPHACRFRHGSYSAREFSRAALV